MLKSLAVPNWLVVSRKSGIGKPTSQPGKNKQALGKNTKLKLYETNKKYRNLGFLNDLRHFCPKIINTKENILYFFQWTKKSQRLSTDFFFLSSNLRQLFFNYFSLYYCFFFLEKMAENLPASLRETTNQFGMALTTRTRRLRNLYKPNKAHPKDMACEAAIYIC